MAEPAGDGVPGPLTAWLAGVPVVVDEPEEDDAVDEEAFGAATVDVVALPAAEPFVGVALLLFAGFGVRRRLGGWDPAWHAATRETEQGVAWRFRWCFVFCCFR